MSDSPVIVLVNTQLPENIGAAARAMMNFGLAELRLVAPREAWPNKRAYDLAANASAILDNARVFATTLEAVADRKRVYAATARPREMVKAVLTPEEGATRMTSENLPAAILFGPERTGLTNDDVTIADAVITIPTGEFPSLNIAQSVVVLSYEWFKAAAHAPEPSSLVHKSEFATKADMSVLLDHLERELDAVDFWKVADKKPKMWVNLRNIFTRADLTEQEVRSLHGVIAELRKSVSDKS